MARFDAFFSRPYLVVGTAIVLRLVLLAYGRWQDEHSPVKYTDIDYLVFTDAARFLSRGRSPYDRATYRYTPLLAWLLYPTTWGGSWFDLGKILFAAGDIVTGWLTYIILRRRGFATARAMRFASIWLLNPMVANISTRGSSEGLVAVIVVALLWASLQKRISLAGCLLGVGVHFKIYPFIYATSIFWWLDAEEQEGATDKTSALLQKFKAMLSVPRLKLAVSSFASFMTLNVAMYIMYGTPFLEHSYRYHLTRIDHRHNFSVYNTLLHLNSVEASAFATQPAVAASHIDSLAFVPQLFLSCIAIPLSLAKKDLASTMLAQTFAFVTFNKVCTSQYFLWYMVFLPFYLPDSSLLKRPRRGVAALALWVLGQAVWLQQGYELEFLGRSTFVPGLWLASISFFAGNCWILGVIVSDVAASDGSIAVASSSKSKKAR